MSIGTVIEICATWKLKQRPVYRSRHRVNLIVICSFTFRLSSSELAVDYRVVSLRQSINYAFFSISSQKLRSRYYRDLLSNRVFPRHLEPYLGAWFLGVHILLSINPYWIRDEIVLRGSPVVKPKRKGC